MDKNEIIGKMKKNWIYTAIVMLIFLIILPIIISSKNDFIIGIIPAILISLDIKFVANFHKYQRKLKELTKSE